MKKNNSAVLIILFCSFAVLLAIADRAPLHLEKDCDCVHLRIDADTYISGVIDQSSPGPYVYRVLTPYLVTGAHFIFPDLSLIDIDLILKIILLFLCQLFFYYYLKNFFSSLISIAGVFVLNILLSFTFSSIIGPSIGENADLLNLAIFILALNALNKNSFIYFLSLLFFRTFNRETTWFLVLILFLNDIHFKKGIYRSALAFIAVAIPYVGLRLIIQPPISDWFNFEGLSKNIPFLSPETTSSALIANALTAFLILPLLIMSLLNFNRQPQFLKVVSYITPLFIIVHYLFGNIIETRLWIPLFALLIPLSLNTLSILLSNKTNLSQSSVKI